jgi:hypothetical protein
LDVRDLDRKPSIPERWVFIVGFLCGEAVFFQGYLGETDLLVNKVLTAAGAGLIGGMFPTALYFLVDSAFWAICHRFRPADQQLSAAIEQAPEEDEVDDPCPFWSPEERSIQDVTKDVKG